MKAERCFLIFLNYLNIFCECPSPGQVETVLDTKFFYHFLALSRPGSTRNKARMKFFHFLNFYTISFGML